MKITDPNVIKILKASRLDGLHLYLPDKAAGAKLREAGDMSFKPDGMLERPMYDAVNKVISALGGKWKGGKVQAHIFPKDVQGLLDAAIETGEYKDPKKEDNYFRTPMELAHEMAERLCLGGNADKVLEPSAGDGHLIDAVIRDRARDVDIVAIERDRDRTEDLKKEYANQQVTAICADFLAVPPEQVYDGVIMNPPFADGKKPVAAAHILHAWKFLKPGCRLVAIHPRNLDRKHKDITALNALIEKCGDVEDVEEKAFSAEGTNVNCVMITLCKPK